MFKRYATALTLTAAMAGGAQAALINRGGGMIYDTVLDVTWLADMNYAKTSGYAAAHLQSGGYNPYTWDQQVLADGQMGWTAAKTWADTLVYGGFSDWRLATITRESSGGAGGELVHLFTTDLGNKSYESVLTTTGDSDEQIANLGMFTNVMVGRYWSGSFGWDPYTLDPDPYTSLAYSTEAGIGGNLGLIDRGPAFALAVRSGDVGQPTNGSTVPEPGMLALLAAAGAGLMAARRRRGSAGVAAG